MAEVIVQEESLVTVADAIREKTGGTEGLVFPTGFAEAISGIGGGFPNGTEWTKIVTRSFTAAYNIKYANGIWVIALAKTGSSGNYYYSTNGIDWYKSSSSVYGADCIEYADGIWVAGSCASAKAGLYYSADGMNWSQSNITSGIIDSVINANGVWVASGSKGIYRSTDGMNWTSTYTPNASTIVCSGKGMFVAGMYSSTKRGLYYSTDAENWTQSNITDAAINAISCNNGLWLASGTSADDIYYSTDGINWTACNSSIAAMCFCNAKGLWVAGTSTTLYYSSDGINWTQCNYAISDIFTEVTYANGIFIAASITTGLHYSTDGINWFQSNITSGCMYSPCNANGIWLAYNYNDSKLYYSITWEQAT